MPAEDVKGKKRKGAQEAAPKAKKARKSHDDAPKANKARKSHDDAPKANKARKSDDDPAAVVKAPAKKSTNARGSKTADEPVADIDEAAEAVEEEGDVPADDQTAALLAGFESDDDSEKDPEEDVDFDAHAPVPKLSKKDRAALEKATQGPRSKDAGVVYVGRIPRGFFESQMKKYFGQFGRVNRLRLSRNKKTGASKHYAFVEFQSAEVADIVARTMDNYLLFGHILKCKLIPAEQVHENLFKGAGGRFKVDPRNKKAGLLMERGVERPQWEKRVESENKRRAGRSKKLLAEFDYEFSAPAVKSVDSVPKQLTNGEAPQLEDAPAEAPVRAKKGKKGAKVNTEQPPMAIEADVQAGIAADVGMPMPEKAVKGKKRKSAVVAEVTVEAEEPVTVEATIKTKKAKKVEKETKAAVAIDETPEKKRKAKAEPDVAKPKKAKKAKA
ncbi:nucleolar protein [Pleosporales sp. CAS-2024a]